MVNVTNYFQNVTDLTGLMSIPNYHTGGWFWVGMTLMFQIIIFVALMPFGVLSAGFSSSFLLLVIGIFLTYMGLIQWQWLMLFLAEILFLIIYVTWQQSE